MVLIRLWNPVFLYHKSNELLITHIIWLFIHQVKSLQKHVFLNMWWRPLNWDSQISLDFHDKYHLVNKCWPLLIIKKIFFQFMGPYGVDSLVESTVCDCVAPSKYPEKIVKSLIFSLFSGIFKMENRFSQQMLTWCWPNFFLCQKLDQVVRTQKSWSYLKNCRF